MSDKREMIEYIEHLLKIGKYVHGNDERLLAMHLVASGCRINVVIRRKKYLSKYSK